MARLLLRLLVVAAVAGVIVVGAANWAWNRYSGPGPAATATTLVIPRGQGTSAIASQLEQAKLVGNRWLFDAAVYLSGERGLKAGEYTIPAHASLADIIDMLHRGLVVVHKLTIPEGFTTTQVMALLSQTQDLAGDAKPPAEGSVLPDTYQFLLGDERQALLARMSREMSATLDELWANRAPGLPLATEEQAVTLASIVERETALPAERPHIAAVFENRLKLGMKLESDPTVIFAVSQGSGQLDRPLSRDDLALDNPYNTYVNTGLPPAPICNPGRASIEAVLHPAQSDDLYFVADGSGGHAFAKTKDEHDKNVAHWRAIEKDRQAASAAKPPVPAATH